MCLFLKVSNTWWSNLFLGQDSHPAHWSPKSSTDVAGTFHGFPTLQYTLVLCGLWRHKFWLSRSVHLMSSVGQSTNLWHEIRFLKALALFAINLWDKTEFVLLTQFSAIKLLLEFSATLGKTKQVLRLISAYHSPEVEIKSSVGKITIWPTVDCIYDNLHSPKCLPLLSPPSQMVN